MSSRAHENFYQGVLLEKAAQFDKAKVIYEDIFRHVTDETVLEKVRDRIEDIDDLIAEKAVYQRIDENAKRVLTEIGINMVENQTLMDILMAADAVDFDNETALFIPLKRDYIDHCLEKMPREMADDQALEGIREIAEKGNPKNADHTLKHVDSFILWEDRINCYDYF